MVRYFTQIYPFGPTAFIVKNSGCLAVVKGRVIPYIKQQRNYAEKGDAKNPAKEEEIDVKLPGFVHPENLKEEGYFTQKARKQLEELKKKPGASAGNSVEKKL